MNLRIIFTLTFLALPSCTFYQDKLGFEDVSLASKNRLSQDLVWRTDTDDDKLIQERINLLVHEPLTATKAIQVSLLNNYELQAKYQSLGLSQAQLVQAGLLSNPSLSISRRWPGSAAEFDITHNFLSILLLPMKKEMAEHEFEAAKLELVQTVLKLAFQTKELFYKYLNLEKEIKLIREKIATTEASLSVAKELRAAGNITALELQTYETISAEQELELIHKNSDKIQLREELNIAMGLSNGQILWKVQDKETTLPQKEFSGENLEEVALGNRPDLLALNQHVISRAKQVGITNIESLLPDFTVTSHFEKEPDGDSSSGPEFYFPIPIFNMGDAQRGASRNFLQQAQSEYQALGVRIRAEVRSAQAQMELNRSKIKYITDHLLPLQNKKLEQAQHQYNAMLIGVFDLLRLKSEQIGTKIELVNAIKDYWINRTSLELALGKELPIDPNQLEKILLSSDHQKKVHTHHSH